MSGAIDLLRPGIRCLKAYRAADYVSGLVRLNANETPWRPPGDETPDGLNRYPDPRSAELTARLAAHYGVQPGALLVTRGSSEAIDLLIRSFCEARRDEIVICPPTFSMYEFYARIQGAAVRAVPLLREQGYALPVAAIVNQWTEQTKLVFVCSPNNPTGNQFPERDIDALCRGLAGRGIVVLDSAYAEFSAKDPGVTLLRDHDNVVVLRTLSKALGLAGVRCGVIIGRPPLVELLGRVLPPYCFPTTSQEAVLRYLTDDAREKLAARLQVLVAERKRMTSNLASVPGVLRVWPSEANFLLVETSSDLQIVDKARCDGILVRDFSGDPLLPGCVRITVGTPAENDLLLHALRA